MGERGGGPPGCGLLFAAGFWSLITIGFTLSFVVGSGSLLEIGVVFSSDFGEFLQTAIDLSVPAICPLGTVPFAMFFCSSSSACFSVFDPGKFKIESLKSSYIWVGHLSTTIMLLKW